MDDRALNVARLPAAHPGPDRVVRARRVREARDDAEGEASREDARGSAHTEAPAGEPEAARGDVPSPDGPAAPGPDVAWEAFSTDGAPDGRTLARTPHPAAQRVVAAYLEAARQAREDDEAA